MGKATSKPPKNCKNYREASLKKGSSADANANNTRMSKKKLYDFLNDYSKGSQKFDLFIRRSPLSIRVYEIIRQQYPKISQQYTGRAPPGIRSICLESNPMQLPCVVSTDPKSTFLRTRLLRHNKNDSFKEAIRDSIP